MRQSKVKLLAFLLTCLMVWMPVLTACDQPEDEPETTLNETELIDSEGLLFASSGDGTCSVEGIGTCVDKDIVIPEVSPDGDIVTEIGDGAFSGCSELTSIMIPDTVTKVFPNSFAGCSQLIQEENGVSYVDKWAIASDESIAVFSLRLDTVGIVSDVFFNCNNLMSITIPDGVTSIGERAFSYCNSLTSITIPNSVTNIGERAFQCCKNLESITVMAGNPVYHSEGNCLIETESKTVRVGCKNSVIPADGSVTSIGVGAFDDCAAITEVSIPNGVTHIGDDAFRGCPALTSVTIPDGVTRIGNSAFDSCFALESIRIPDSVISIGSNAFLGSPVGECVWVDNTYYNGIEYLDNWLIDYTDRDNVFGNNTIVREGTVGICDGAFYHCAEIKTIVIPDSIKIIGDGAFDSCPPFLEVKYNGSMEQWKKIVIGHRNTHLYSYPIHCTDGDILPES